MKPIFAIVTIVGLICAALGVSARATSAQQPRCLHGQDETAAQRDRRQQALRTARQINTYRVNGRGQAGRFQPLTAFPGIVTPPGFAVHVATDGTTYAFSIKDTVDPCAFAYFSDDSGLIYMGQALR
jgi:hypothetical protein